MASKNTTNTTASKNGRQRIERSNSDSARWIAGLLLLFVGVFAASSVLFSFFSWAADQSGLQLSPEERLTLGVEPENLCGWAGAKLGRLLVDNSFGVFGILIPTMIILVGVRIIRQRPLLFNHSILSLFLIMILGSLTLGFAFGDKWSLCSSTGWGGAFGIETGALLHTHIGVFGTLILLVGCWILTGVFINRNFINKVNRAGNVMVDKSGRIVEIIRSFRDTSTPKKPTGPFLLPRRRPRRMPPGQPERSVPPNPKCRAPCAYRSLKRRVLHVHRTPKSYVPPVSRKQPRRRSSAAKRTIPSSKSRPTAPPSARNPPAKRNPR